MVTSLAEPCFDGQAYRGTTLGVPAVRNTGDAGRIQAGRICEGCGNPIPANGRGEPRRFCSAACRLKVWRQKTVSKGSDRNRRRRGSVSAYTHAQQKALSCTARHSTPERETVFRPAAKTVREVIEGRPSRSVRSQPSDLKRRVLRVIRQKDGMSRVLRNRTLLGPILDLLGLPRPALRQKNFRYRLAGTWRTAYLSDDGKGGQYVLHVPRMRKHRVWTLPELYHLQLTGRRRQLGKASMTWFLFLLWDAGFIPAPASGLPVLEDVWARPAPAVARLWGLLSYLRDLAYPAEPVMFSVRFAQGLIRAVFGECALQTAHSAIAVLRLSGLIHRVDGIAPNLTVRWRDRGPAMYVCGNGLPDPLYRRRIQTKRTPQERASARKRIAHLARAALMFEKLPLLYQRTCSDFDGADPFVWLDRARLAPCNGITDEQVRQIVEAVGRARNRWRSDSPLRIEASAMKTMFATQGGAEICRTM